MKPLWLLALLPGMAFSQAIFAPVNAVPFNPGLGAFPGTTGDFNGDGNLDLAYYDQGGDGITVLLGDGHGGFTASFAYQGGLEPTGWDVLYFFRNSSICRCKFAE
jgi:hypothetical protein